MTARERFSAFREHNQEMTMRSLARHRAKPPHVRAREPLFYAASFGATAVFLMVYWSMGNIIAFWPSVGLAACAVVYLIMGVLTWKGKR